MIQTIKNRLLFILPLFISCQAFAGFQIGISTNYFKINDDFKHYTGFNKPTINYGYNYIYKSFVITALSNRFLSQTNSETIKKNNLTFESKVKITSDTLSLGYRINRFIPYWFLTNARIEKSLYRDKLLGKTDQHSILCGLGTTFIYDKDINFNISIIAPNKEQELDYGLNFSINYNL